MRTLELPEPFGLPALAEVLSERLGRPVEFLPLPAGSLGTCGVLVSTDRAEYIGYPTGTTVLHQQHIVLHEVGHLLGGHQDTTTTPVDSAALGVLAPHLSTELVRRMLGRDVYSDVQEREAELFASLVLHRQAGRRPQPGPPGVAQRSEAAARLDALFGSPVRQGGPARQGSPVRQAGSWSADE
ncbi:ParH-like protein [Kitasatospora acidiphila]|uniref:ParH-like protein n=1 Tax=Kitasatospora acidiphila TaxID=2567942 RepID=A0A540WBP9_9ACTN|nr:ParH-like protein [Kitasatospora acidiphila]TQF06378.1 ParH-like protein [Kitasatospora acidiphila]